MSTPETIYETAAQTAKRIRKILKIKFPGIKFSVRSKTYAGGSSVNVKWMDGPRDEKVQEAVQWLESAEFDSMTDLKTYTPPTFVTDAGWLYRVSGAGYIFCGRNLSDEKQAEMENRVRDFFTAEESERILGGPHAWHWINKLDAEAYAKEDENAATSGGKGDGPETMTIINNHALGYLGCLRRRGKKLGAHAVREVLGRAYTAEEGGLISAEARHQEAVIAKRHARLGGMSYADWHHIQSRLESAEHQLILRRERTPRYLAARAVAETEREQAYLRREKREREHEARRELDKKIRRAIQIALRKRGFRREHTSGSGSNYYERYLGAEHDFRQQRVRISDHEVPETAERSHAAANGGFTWATHGIIIILGDHESPEEAVDSLADWLGENERS